MATIGFRCVGALLGSMPKDLVAVAYDSTWGIGELLLMLICRGVETERSRLWSRRSAFLTPGSSGLSTGWVLSSRTADDESHVKLRWSLISVPGGVN